MREYDEVPRYAISIWEERDRLIIHVYDDIKGKEVAEWIDDDARDMFTDGFFTSGNVAESVFDYLCYIGLASVKDGWYTD